MAVIERFEDIQAWQKARTLTAEIYRMTRNGDIARDYGFRDQIRRASVSIMSNIAEGFERESDRDFNRFLSIAKGSAGEVRSQLYVAHDTEMITDTKFTQLRSLTEEVSRMISRFM